MVTQTSQHSARCCSKFIPKHLFMMYLHVYYLLAINRYVVKMVKMVKTFKVSKSFRYGHILKCERLPVRVKVVVSRDLHVVFMLFCILRAEHTKHILVLWICRINVTVCTHFIVYFCYCTTFPFKCLKEIYVFIKCFETIFLFYNFFLITR